METNFSLKLNSNSINFAHSLVKLTTTHGIDAIITKDKYVIDARSILGVLSLAGLKGSVIRWNEQNNDFVEDLMDLIG